MTAIDTFKTTADGGTTQVWTAAVSGTPTGGTYTLTFTGTDAIAAQTLTLAYNTSAAALQTAIRALTGTGFSQATVSASGSGANLTHTITLKGMREDVQLSRSIAGLTGGTPALALTETTAYAAIPLVSTQSIAMAKQALVDWCETFASNLRA
jgi:hypothetical protein